VTAYLRELKIRRENQKFDPSRNRVIDEDCSYMYKPRVLVCTATIIVYAQPTYSS